MKTSTITLAAAAILLAVACTSKKKSAANAPSAPAPTVTAPVSPAGTATNAVAVVKSKDGIYAPGSNELNALSMRYNDITPEHLNEGYKIYTKGACTNCHVAYNIYRYDEALWKRIVDDMAKRAMISDVEKDAVYKYVLAIKATQPK